jgi:uncharacterized protein YjbJ (UPF0337 family)
MHDDTVTTSWKRLTDQAKALPSKRVKAAFAVAPRVLPQAARGEAIQQAAQLAGWEGEGGTTSNEVCRTREPCMDWNHVEASWQQFRGEVHANWGRLTPVHLDIIAGRRACLSNEIEEAYGVTSEEAERQIKSFEARNQHPRPVSFR